ncbi:unnamed protein product [Tuber aestivum]|uniref:Uncharacterized protein n=1 Tax=Tuber aestivum TaxID=59557 RepID=A0A292PZL5_9PEZI|nr:unnamed protein product [Tuber aestivum]
MAVRLLRSCESEVMIGDTHAAFAGEGGKMAVAAPVSVDISVWRAAMVILKLGYRYKRIEKVYGINPLELMNMYCYLYWSQRLSTCAQKKSHPLFQDFKVKESRRGHSSYIIPSPRARGRR